MVLLGDGPRVTEPAGLPWDWWGVRVAAPILASILAFFYLRRNEHDAQESMLTGDGLAETQSNTTRSPSLRMQLQFALIGLPLMVCIVRLIDGPIAYATKIAAFGAADALAYQLIAFGVAAALFQDRQKAALTAVIAFAVSWCIRDLILAIVGDSGGSIVFTIIGGLITGLLIALACLALRRWPGGFWPVWGAQWLVISLIIGFT
jgi:hypothetical protein